MRPADLIHFTATALCHGHRVRTGLMLLAMAIGVAAVVVLTALGDGARRYVSEQFAALGTHLIVVLPGRSETAGVNPGTFLGETLRDLTLADARALTHSSLVTRIAPINIGSAPVSFGPREREVTVIGTNADFLKVRRFKMAQGRFLPKTDLTRGDPVAVIGTDLRDELFGAHSALGQWLRIGDRRFRIIGVLSSQGEAMGLNTGDLVIIPVAAAQRLFNTASLFRILVEARSREAMARVQQHIKDTIKTRHQGEEDVTVITQDAVLATFDKVFRALTFGVGGIAAISLGVAGILIMNVMLISVTQRTREIGLLMALGATPRQIELIFTSEAAALSLLGGLAGLAVGQLGSWGIAAAYPALPAQAPLWAVLAALGVALGCGVLFGLLPARRAARLDPVLALART